jgi:hypothetical protein
MMGIDFLDLVQKGFSFLKLMRTVIKDMVNCLFAIATAASVIVCQVDSLKVGFESGMTQPETVSLDLA